MWHLIVDEILYSLCLFCSVPNNISILQPPTSTSTDVTYVAKMVSVKRLNSKIVGEIEIIIKAKENVSFCFFASELYLVEPSGRKVEIQPAIPVNTIFKKINPGETIRLRERWVVTDLNGQYGLPVLKQRDCDDSLKGIDFK
jgi:hypothetical protein